MRWMFAMVVVLLAISSSSLATTCREPDVFIQEVYSERIDGASTPQLLMPGCGPFEIYGRVETIDFDGTRAVAASGADYRAFDTLWVGDSQKCINVPQKHFQNFRYASGLVLLARMNGESMAFDSYEVASERTTRLPITIPAPGGVQSNFMLGNRTVAWVEPGPDSWHVNIYDARANSFILRNATQDSLGIDSPWVQPLATSDRWTVFAAVYGTGSWIVDHQTQSSRPVPQGFNSQPRRIDGDWLYGYGAHATLVRMNLRTHFVENRTGYVHDAGPALVVAGERLLTLEIETEEYSCAIGIPSVTVPPIASAAVLALWRRQRN